MTSSKQKRISLSREGWLELALETFTDHAKNKFSLDGLLKAMPVGKGSFYHHFKNRAEFLVALVDYWDRKETQNVIFHLDSLPGESTPEERLWELMRIVHETHRPRRELVIRAMADEIPVIRERLKAVDRKRFETVHELFAEMGFEGKELDTRTRVFVTTTTFDGQIRHGDPEESLRMLKHRHRWFTREN